MGVAEKVLKVRGQRSDRMLYVRLVNKDSRNGGGMHFDGVTSKLTCFVNFMTVENELTRKSVIFS